MASVSENGISNEVVECHCHLLAIGNVQEVGFWFWFLFVVVVGFFFCFVFVFFFPLSFKAGEML